MSKEEFREMVCKCSLSDYDLANLIGISASTVRRWRDGKTAPHSFMYDRVKAALDQLDQVVTTGD